MHLPSPAQIVEISLEYFARAGVDISVVDEGLSTSDGQVFGLEPLRRRMANVPASEWRAFVTSHFDTLRGADTDLPDTFAQARANLRSAVIAEADLGLFDGAIMERRIAAGLGERLMLKRGSLGLTLSRDVAASWKVPAERIWEQARTGSLLDEPVDVSRRRVPKGVNYSVLSGGRWTSTRVLDLSCHLDPYGIYGAIVAVPERGEVLVHDIVDDRFSEAAVAMLDHSIRSFTSAPLPVGCDLFWYFEGAIERICTPGKDRFEYQRVPAFSSMLWRLEEDLAEGRPERRTG